MLTQDSPATVDRTAPLHRESLISVIGPASAQDPAGDWPITTRLERLQPSPTLANDWCHLEAQSPDHSFFVSWRWIETWLHTLPPDAEVWKYEALRAGLLVGVALLVRSSVRVAGLVRRDCWWLHASGRADHDALFIEHNDVLCVPGLARAVRLGLVAAWQRTAESGAQLRLPGVREREWRCLRHVPMVRRHDRREAYVLDALADRDRVPQDPIELYGSHTRRAIRRSLKEYERRGPVSLKRPIDTAEALTWFEEMVRWNDERQSDKGGSSTCATAVFQRFHRRLLTCNDARVRMVAIDAGTHRIAYLYAFLQGQRAYVYQSGLNFDTAANNNERPGYVAHYLAAAQWSREGQVEYDLMAGDYRYKENLSNRRDMLDWIVLHRKDWLYALEQRWLELKAHPRAQQFKKLLKSQ